MDWNALGAIGEIVGAAAVVVSLLYLATQTRANARALRTDAAWNAEVVFGQNNNEISRDPAFCALWARASKSDADTSEFTEGELMQVFFGVRAVLQYAQAQWFLWRDGSLPEEIWDLRRHGIRAALELPVFRYCWEKEIEQQLMDPRLIHEIDSAPVRFRSSFG